MTPDEQLKHDAIVLLLITTAQTAGSAGDSIGILEEAKTYFVVELARGYGVAANAILDRMKQQRQDTEPEDGR